MDAQIIDNRPRANGGIKLIGGVFLVVFGALLAANNLHLVDADRYLRYWPLFVIAAGVMKVLEPGQGIGGVILLIAGGSLLAWNLGWVRFTIFDLWPLILIGIGLMMVGRAAGLVGENRGTGNFALFSSPKVTETSPDYRGGQLSAIMAAYQLDLTAADIAQSPAVLNVFAMWGSIEVIVPDNWEVVTEVTPVMAGVDVKTSRSMTERKRQLVIRGFVMWGAVEVKSGTRRSA